jgi:cytochrome c oxidase subunit 2
MTLLSATSLAASLTGMPEQGSTVAPGYDWLWQVLLAMTAFFTVLIMGCLIYFVVKNRQRTAADRANYSKGTTHSTPLELTWIVVPTVIVIALFVWGFRLFLDMNQAPSNAYEVIAVAKQWDWTFQYPDGSTSRTLHVPADTPIKVQLQSNDVIHSFFVPAFRVKKDVVPGRYNKTWFQANWDPSQARKLSEVSSQARQETADLKVISHPLYCAEYCGRAHSAMLSSVVVHENQAAFRTWLEAQAGPPEGVTPVEAGEQVYLNQCAQCHQVAGQGGAQGPAWDDLFGRQERMADGRTIEADEQYIRDSILNPNQDIVAGYENAGAMPTFRGLLDEWQITALIEYMKSISDNTDSKPLGSFEDQ